MSAISDFCVIASPEKVQESLHEGEVTLLVRGNKRTGTESKAVAVPVTSTKRVLGCEELYPHIAEWFRAMQTARVRDIIERERRLSFHKDEVSPEAIANWLAAQGRLTGAQIEEYMETQKDTILALLCEKLGWHEGIQTGEQEKKVSQLLKGLKDTFSELAGRKVFWEEKKRKNALENWLEYFEDSPIKEKMIAKIQGMSQENSEDLLDALGF